MAVDRGRGGFLRAAAARSSLSLPRAPAGAATLAPPGCPPALRRLGASSRHEMRCQPAATPGWCQPPPAIRPLPWATRTRGVGTHRPHPQPRLHLLQPVRLDAVVLEQVLEGPRRLAQHVRPAVDVHDGLLALQVPHRAHLRAREGGACEGVGWARGGRAGAGEQASRGCSLRSVAAVPAHAAALLLSGTCNAPAACPMPANVLPKRPTCRPLTGGASGAAPTDSSTDRTPSTVAIAPPNTRTPGTSRKLGAPATHAASRDDWQPALGGGGGQAGGWRVGDVGSTGGHAHAQLPASMQDSVQRMLRVAIPASWPLPRRPSPPPARTPKVILLQDCVGPQHSAAALRDERCVRLQLGAVLPLLRLA